jgi:hypothetical protein
MEPASTGFGLLSGGTDPSLRVVPESHDKIPDSLFLSRCTVPSIMGDSNFNVDLTPTQPVVAEEECMSFNPHLHRIRIVDMEPIKEEDKATLMIKETYINNILSVNLREGVTQMYEVVHATWTALVTMHKTGERIHRVSICPKYFDKFQNIQGSLNIFPHLPSSGSHSRASSNTKEDIIVHTPLTPTRPRIRFEKTTERTYWIRIIEMEPVPASDILPAADAEKATRTMKDRYVDKIVYLESAQPLQGREVDLAAWTALITWHKTGAMCGLAIGRRPVDITIIAPRNLYEPPFRIKDIPGNNSMLSLIPVSELLVQGYLANNVDVVRLRNPSDMYGSKLMIHKKMTPETSPEDMIWEAGRYLALKGCKYAPRFIGVTGIPETGECRGLLIELIEGLLLSPIPFMYNNMRCAVTMNLVNAMVEFEERHVYLQDLKPNNIILTIDDGLCVIDFGPGVTEGMFPEEDLDEILNGRANFKTAMYGLFMTLRVIWNEGVLGSDGHPTAPTRLREQIPRRLLSILDNPRLQVAEYSDFQSLQKALREEMPTSPRSEGDSFIWV